MTCRGGQWWGAGRNGRGLGCVLMEKGYVIFVIYTAPLKSTLYNFNLTLDIE